MVSVVFDNTFFVSVVVSLLLLLIAGDLGGLGGILGLSLLDFWPKRLLFTESPNPFSFSERPDAP